jgi:hypothetical protein
MYSGTKKFGSRRYNITRGWRWGDSTSSFKRAQHVKGERERERNWLCAGGSEWEIKARCKTQSNNGSMLGMCIVQWIFCSSPLLYVCHDIHKKKISPHLIMKERESEWNLISTVVLKLCVMGSTFYICVHTSRSSRFIEAGTHSPRLFMQNWFMLRKFNLKFIRKAPQCAVCLHCKLPLCSV